MTPIVSHVDDRAAAIPLSAPPADAGAVEIVRGVLDDTRITAARQALSVYAAELTVAERPVAALPTDLRAPAWPGRSFGDHRRSPWRSAG